MHGCGALDLFLVPLRTGHDDEPGDDEPGDGDAGPSARKYQRAVSAMTYHSNRVLASVKFLHPEIILASNLTALVWARA
jgi:hypothetical protein